MLHGPELQDASITAMLLYIMDGSVSPLVCDVSQDTSIADVHVINDSEEAPCSLVSEKMVRIAC